MSIKLPVITSNFESLKNYYERFIYLASLPEASKIEADMTVSCFIDGLHDSKALKTKESEFKSITDAYVAAKELVDEEGEDVHAVFRKWNKNDNKNYQHSNRNNRHCNFCNRPGHSEDTCYAKNGGGSRRSSGKGSSSKKRRREATSAQMFDEMGILMESNEFVSKRIKRLSESLENDGSRLSDFCLMVMMTEANSDILDEIKQLKPHPE